MPAQQRVPNSNGFVPLRQRSSPVSIPLPGTVEVDEEIPDDVFSDKIGRFVREVPNQPEELLQDKILR